MKFLRFVAAGLVLTSALYAAPTLAVPVMDINPEDLVAQAADIKKMLSLSLNQQTLWQQVEPKIRTIVRERQRRRADLQAQIKSKLDDAKTELRDVSKLIAQEEDISVQENKELRELWLSINDALDDNQRQIILRLFGDELQRSLDEKCTSDKAQKSDTCSRGMGRKSGGNGGMAIPGSQ